MEIGPGLWLSHCPRLSVVIRPQGVLIGTAIPTDERDDPASWAGRWVLITGDDLRPDACGMLGVFHSAGWASSSPALLEGKREPPLSREAGAMNWYPPPRSGKVGVARLLPSQVLDLRTGRVVHQPLLTTPSGPPEDRLITALGRLSGPLWLPLTGGLDSRTLLAASVAAGVEATTFTFVGDHTPLGDRDLPPLLAASVGYQHRTIAWQPEDPARLAAFETETAGHSIDGALRQVPRGLWDHIPEDATVLGGGCFETGRLYYHRKLPKDAGDAASMAALILSRRPGDAVGIGEWTRWVEAHPEPMDWRDRLYMEQRIGGWLSSDAQGIDSTGRQVIHLANCTAFLSEVLDIPVEDRVGGAHQLAMIERLAPVLAGFPVNPKASEAPPPDAPPPLEQPDTRRSLFGLLRRSG